MLKNELISSSADACFSQERIVRRAGLGDNTYLPPAVLSVPAEINMANARREFEVVMFEAVKDVLAKTGVHPRQVRL